MDDLQRANRRLDVLNILLSDVRYGLGAYAGVYLLTEHGWNPAELGLAFSAGGLTGLLAQTPIGLFVDATRHKRLLIAVCVLVVTACCLLIPVAPGFGAVTAGAVVGALAGTAIAPTLAAISLGMVGPARFARRAARNEAMFHAGNAAVNVAILLAAPFVGSPILFWLMAATGLASAVAALRVPEASIDHEMARGAGGAVPSAVPSLRLLLNDRCLLVFAFAGALFHLANGPMLSLIAQKLALAHLGQGIALTAACAIAAQVVMVPTAFMVGARADRWGRRPLLLLAFLALALRAFLATLGDGIAWLVPLQALDGVAAGLIGVLFPIVIADRTRGSGHFAAAQGAIGTVHGLGGLAGGLLAGFLATRYGYDTAFLVLFATALFGATVLWALMPDPRATPVSTASSSPLT